MISLTDEYTVAIGIAAITAYFASKILVPPSLVHPLLLGRQSHVAQVRKENESAVYRNYGTGTSHVSMVWM
jgi:long-chain acyl-CoA synthetase